nr:phospholipase A1-like [Onthophagus taurus]
MCSTTIMRRYIIAVLTLIFAVALIDANTKVQRQYDPKEEDPNRVRYIYVDDGMGGYERIDLFEPDPRRRPITLDDLTFLLYTKKSKKHPDTIPANNFNISRSKFNASLPNVFVSHGWNNHAKSPVNTIIGSAILEHFNVNLFIIDWSGPANLNYFSARAAVPIIGEFVGDFINKLMTTYRIKAEKFHLVGHSLGAHLVGCAGAKVNGLVKSIVGLDPAGPLYTVSKIDDRIDPSDGEFVHVIHTNSGWLGFSSSLGHADYYPNGGKTQPGCGLDLVGICSHARAYEFYAESIYKSAFHSRLCGSMDDFEQHMCNSNHKSLMGHLHVDKSASGDYFLKTRSNSPFAMG